MDLSVCGLELALSLMGLLSAKARQRPTSFHHFLDRHYHHDYVLEILDLIAFSARF